MTRRKNIVHRAWKAEPAVIVSLVSAVITLGVSFGLKLTHDQIAAITALVTILAGFITRSQVTPTKKGKRP